MPGIIAHEHFFTGAREYSSEFSIEDWKVLLKLPWTKRERSLIKAFYRNQNSPISENRARKLRYLKNFSVSARETFNRVFLKCKISFRLMLADPRMTTFSVRLYKFKPRKKSGRRPR